MKNKILTMAAAILTAVAIFIGVYVDYTKTGKIDKDKVNEAVDTIVDAINTYEMTDEQVEALPSTEIHEQTEEQENKEDSESNSEIQEEGKHSLIENNENSTEEKEKQQEESK